MPEKQKIAFILLFNLREGAGNENWLISLLGETDFSKKYDVTVYQPDIFLNERLSPSYIVDKLKNVNIYVYHDYIHKVDIFNEKLNFLVESLIRPVFCFSGI